MATDNFRKRFLLYPEPVQAPNVPSQYDGKQNPAVRGYLLIIAAWVMEYIGFVRRTVWANAGFGSLPSIREHIELIEPRFEPAVFPREDYAAVELKNGHTQGEDKPRQLAMPPDSSRLRYSVADYRELYLSGEITPLDVVRAILPFIRRDTSPPGLHSVAWIDVKVDLVMKAAELSTMRYKENRSLGPLDGVPTAVKDEYDMDGYVTSLGSSNDYAGQELHDGTTNTWCVRKLEEAGAIILGKLAMHEFGLDTSGINITWGTPRNPYNPNYYPGGSSSGPAYAVSNGLVPVALGSDGGGSIRIPAACCSVYGLKPSHGRVSFYPGQNHSLTCGVNGPLAADIRSLAEIYDVISVPDPTSSFPKAAPVAGLLATSTNRAKTIGIDEAWFQRATPSVQKLCRAMIDKLVSQKGYKIVPITFPFLKEGQTAHALTVLSDAASLLPVTQGFSPANKILLALGRTSPSTDWVLAQKLRHVLMRHLSWLWEQHPGMIIVTPMMSCAGWPIRSPIELKYGVSDGDRTLETMEYVWMANFLGVPGISVPAGYVIPEGQAGAGEIAQQDTQGKVPIGLMAMGNWTSELELLQFGLEAEELAPETLCRPPEWVDVIDLARLEAKQR